MRIGTWGLAIAGGCATEWEPVACGSGTSDVDGRCEIVEVVIDDCGEGETLHNGDCTLADADSYVLLPFAEGREVQVSQGFHGPFSHTGSSAYALDFPAPVGTVVHAIRPGRVLSLREANDSGCSDASCANLANNVVIDHGDGTFALYVHLERDGVLVEEDEVVAQGQPIALSGNTGFSTGPHLHLEVRDIFGTSQPLRFVEFLDLSDGVPFSGHDVRSENQEQGPPEAASWSTCPTDLFAFLGVMLDPGLPCGRVGDHTVLTGHVVVEGAVALVSVLGNGGFDTACADPGETFAVDVPWETLGQSGLTTFAVSAADPATCQSIRASAQGALVFVR